MLDVDREMDGLSSMQEVLQRHLRLIVEACKNLQPNLTAVILYGGFGRDEGSWLQDSDGTWRPYNDYDICIVTDQKAPAHEVKALEKSLAQEIGINWIDLSQLSPDEMKRLRLSIKNYDFKNASKVIYGDKTVLDRIPAMDASTLPMKEAQILYFTRLYTLLGSLDENGLDQNLGDEPSRFFRNQMAKAILAIVDVLLLAKGAYDASYCRRVERVVQLYPEKKELIELSRWAHGERLRPQAPDMNSRQARRMYQSVHGHYFSEMYRALSLHFAKRIDGPQDVEFCMKWLPLNLLKRFYWLLKFRSLRAEKQVSLMLAQSYLAAAWAPDRINEKFLRQGLALLRRLDDRLSTESTWDQARLEAARLRTEL